jgi:hypothetical protein
VATAAYRLSGTAQDEEDHANNQQNDADGLKNRDLGYKTNDKEDESQDNHVPHLNCAVASRTFGIGNCEAEARGRVEK